MTKTKQAQHAGRATAGARAGYNAVRSSQARLVEETLRHTRNGDPRVLAEALSKKLATDGDVRNFVGHLFEKADITANNARFSGAPKMTPAASSTNPGFDATRLMGGKRQLIDQKFSAGKAAESARKTSNPDRIFRVPKDQLKEATRKIDGRAAVEPSKLSQGDVNRIAKNGLKDAAKKSTPNAAKVVGSAAVAGAVVNAVVGAVGESGALKRGELTKTDFAVNRAVDAVEGAAGGAAAAGVGVAAVSVVAVVGTGGVILIPVAAAAAGMGATALVKVGTKHLRRQPVVRPTLTTAAGARTHPEPASTPTASTARRKPTPATRSHPAARPSLGRLRSA